MRIAALLMLVSAASLAQAQDRPFAHADLPRGVEIRLNAIIDNPSTRKFTGEVFVGDTVPTDVVVFNGPLTLSGRVTGQLIVIDGDVIFKPGSSVVGDVTVVNGEARDLDNTTIDGTITMYGEGFGFFHRGERVLSMNTRTRRVYRDDERRYWGHSELDVAMCCYNRVEGMPLNFGPTIETSGRNPTRLEAHAIWRTEVNGPFVTNDWGYSVRAEQFFGGRHDVKLGASLHSVIDPIENWQLSRNEAGLATLVLHEDYQDYFERKGWSVYGRFAPRATGFSATAEYNDETHSAQPARDPWTVFGGDPWRLQPLVAEGRFRSASATLEMDTRDHEDFPTDGFLVRGKLTQGIGGSWAAPYDARFTTGLIDARVYRAVNSDGTLSFRFVGAGTLDHKAAPPQFQHALGGAGSMPGYSLFEADCGARNVAVTRTENGKTNGYYPYYGCDRMATFSAEYRGGFDIHFGSIGKFWGDDDEEDEEDNRWSIDSHPNWLVFFDTGRGWAEGNAAAPAHGTGALYDVGGGILVGDFGIYGAVPLTGTERSMKFFIRLGARF